MLDPTLLTQIHEMAYFGDVHGLQAALEPLNDQQMSAAEVTELLEASTGGGHPYHAAISTALRRFNPDAESPAPSPQELSPAQQAMHAALSQFQSATAPFLVHRDSATPAIQSSYFGGQPYALPDEPWPEYEDVPMTFVCHLWFADAAISPPAAGDIAALSLFMHTEEHPGTELGEGWYIRTYTAQECLRLQRQQPPTPDDLLPGCWAVDWRPPVNELLPHLEDAECYIPDFEDLQAAHNAWLQDHPSAEVDEGDEPTDPVSQVLKRHQSLASCKLFGYPYSLQGNELTGDGFSFVLQLVPIARIGLEMYEGGFAYFGIETKDDGSRRWICHFECY